jgi:hypothetical protein
MTPLNDVLNHWAEALGGRERLAGIKSTMIDSQVFVGQGIRVCGTQQLWFKADACYRCDLEISGGTSLLTVADTPSNQAWLRDSDDRVTTLGTAAWETVRSHLYWLLNGALVDCPMAGSIVLEEETDKHCRLEARPQGGTSFKLLINKKAWLPDELVGLDGPGVRTIFKDWRAVDGVRFPFKSLQMKGDVGGMATAIKKVVIGSSFDTGLFTMPSRGATPVTFESSTNQIPFTLISNNVYTHARLNDIEGLFAIDTGTSSCVVNQPCAKRAELCPRCTFSEDLGGGAEDTTVTMTEGVHFGLPGVTYHNHNLLVMDLGRLTHDDIGRSIDGIMGSNFLRHTVMELDMADLLLRLHDPEGFQAPPVGQQLSISVNGCVPYVKATIDVGGQEISATYMLDTGTQEAVYFSNSFVQEHELQTLIPNLRDTVGFGQGGEYPAAVGRIGALTIGTQCFEQPVAKLCLMSDDSLKGTGCAGMIGSEIWRRFALFLSYTDRQIWLTPNRAFSEPFEDDMSGLMLVAEGPGYHEFEICFVMSDSPASQVGLQKGDWMTSLDGVPATDLSLERIRTAFKQEGARRILGIRRNEETLQVEITLQRLV